MKSVVSIVLSAHVSMCSGDVASVKTFEILSFQFSDDKHFSFLMMNIV